MSKQDGFEKRLNEARARQGLDRAEGSSAGLPGGSYGVGFRAGVEVFSALLGGGAAARGVRGVPAVATGV
jgi:ATP synthase protein I